MGSQAALSERDLSVLGDPAVSELCDPREVITHAQLQALHLDAELTAAALFLQAAHRQSSTRVSWILKTPEGPVQTQEVTRGQHLQGGSWVCTVTGPRGREAQWFRSPRAPASQPQSPRPL